MTPASTTHLPSHAIVTPTYNGDFDRCALLVESLGRIGGHHPHYLIVDRRDLPLFRRLESDRTVLIASETIIDSWLRRMPGRKGYWLSFRAPPVRGWIIQQMLKIGAIRHIPEDVLIFCDSDTAFFRPFTITDVLTDGRVDLLDVSDTSGSVPLWTEVASRLLGLNAADVPLRNHVGNMICWRRPIIEQMQRRVEAVTGLPWQVAIARELRFSEYMLYGIFVRALAGYEEAGHAPSLKPVIKPSWNASLSDAASIDAFFGDFAPATVGVMLHSKEPIDAIAVRRNLERLWDRL